MPAKKRKTSLDASANKKRKARDRNPDDPKESPSPQSSVVASMGELPGRVATRKAAAVVDANPPYRQLLETQEHSIESQPGESVVYWMRMDDMRIEQNRALDLAVNHARRYRIPLLVLFVISLGDYKAHDRSPRRIDFMLRNLKVLQSSLNILDIPLCIISHTPRTSIPHRVIAQLHEWRATRVFANIEYGVDELRRDIKVITLGREDEPVIEATFVDDKSIVSPGKLATLKGKQYTVYSPWLKAWTDHVKSHPEIIRPLPLLTANDPHIRSSTSLYHTLFETPVPDFLPGFECVDAEKMAVLWPAGISAARQVFERFLQTRARRSQLGDSSPLADGAETIRNESRLALYKDDRNRCDIDGSSRMSSPYLASGVISAQELIRLSMAWTLDSSNTSSAHINTDRTTFLGSYTSEIAWRDFYSHVMCAFPRLSMGRPYLEKFVEVKWETDGKALEKWMQGRTGVPIVDAAMRQANTQGWMHNRARMIAATYLAKDLMIDWRLGEKYFMQQFIDGDLSSNNGGWQWCASTGTDSQPYFRIFNPYTQAEKADPSGDYIRHFVPELKDLEGKALYNPHNHLDAITFERLGYPAPLIDHAEARERALRRYKNPGEL